MIEGPDGGPSPTGDGVARRPGPGLRLAGRGPAITAGVALLVVVGALLVLMGSKGPARLGDNGRVGGLVGGFLDPTHHRSCTTLKRVPDGTGVARLEVVALDGASKAVLPDRVVRDTHASVRVPGRASRPVPVRVDGTTMRIALAGGLARTGAQMCLRQPRSAGFALSIRGVGPDPVVRDAPMGIVYERAGEQSWWTRAGAVVDHVAAIRPAHQGTWTLWLGLALMAAAVVGGLATAAAAVTGRLGHGRRAVAIVVAVGVCSSASWAFVTPPYETPDAQAHVSYVSWVAHHGRAADSGFGALSPAAQATVDYTRVQDIRFQPIARPPFTRAAAGPRPRDDLSDRGGVLGNAQANPILYYAAAAVPYRLSGAGPFGGELLVRLLSALCFGATVAGVLLALREMLPGAPRLAAVGALLVALLPQAAFISGSVNPDALLFAVSSLFLWRLARAFRRGLGVRDGVVIGLLLVAAALSKLAGLMLLPGAAIALVVLVLRLRRGDDRVTRKGLLAAIATFAAPFALYQLANIALWGQSTTGGAQVSRVGSAGNLADRLSYTWQFFLPRLSSMQPKFDASPLQEVYLRQLVGDFGWIDTQYSQWVYDVGRPALLVAAVVAVLWVVVRRGALRGRVGELLAYLVTLVGFVGLISYLGFNYRQDLGLGPGGGVFEQVRYLFPLLVFFGAMAVAAIRMLGRRLAPHAAVVLVALAGLLSASGLLTTVARFYS